jgi:succinate-semialdehyde dehydrogenase/glutarate-semialdehyde dehydrogenase
VQDALDKGARLLLGGARLTGDEYARGFFFPPTVLANTNHTMQIMTQETFGPVVGIMPFASLDDALSLANDSIYGLAAYVFSRDIGTAWRAAEQLEAGSVWVNNIHRSYNLVPFGGYKQSGLGREKSRRALDEYMEYKTIYLGI